MQHADVLTRIHGGGAPASGEGKGYQDILIWGTLVAALDRDPHIVLVSRDKDFAGADGKLDAGLASEAKRQHPDSQVSLVQSLQDLVDAHVVVDGFSFDKARQYEFEEALVDALIGRWLEPDVGRVATPGSTQSWISTVMDMSDVELQGVHRLPEGQIAFTLLADVYAHVSSDRHESSGDPDVDVTLTVRADLRCPPDSGPPTYVGVTDISVSG